MFLGAALAQFSSSSSLIGKANDDLINGTKLNATLLLLVITFKYAISISNNFSFNKCIYTSSLNSYLRILWLKHNYFKAGDLTKEAFSIVIPPPNVTGKLHLGHAWDSLVVLSVNVNSNILRSELSSDETLILPFSPGC